jgi:lipopolysaccharide transport system ATP-binding protein
MSDAEVLIKAENVSKRFCRSLKRSLWYGVQGVLHSLNPLSSGQQDMDLHRPVSDSDLRKDEFWSLRDLCFEVRRGECLGLIGHNGAGKSTLLKILNGLMRPDRGRVTMRGRVAALIELNAGFNGLLTGRENIINQATLLGFSRGELNRRFDDIVEFSGLHQFLDMPVQNYSSGMKVKLGFSVYAMLRPDVLIIDEVLAVGDVAFRLKCLNAIGEMMRTAAVVFVSHSMPQVFRVCSEVLVLDHGASVYAGRNISAGVSRYLELAADVEHQVTGAGTVDVRGLELTGVSGRAGAGDTLSVPHGTGFTVTVTLEAKQPVGSARLELLLWNSEMLPVLELMTKELAGYCFEFDRDQRAVVRVRMPHLDLGPGAYTLSVIVTNIDHSLVHCRHDCLATVRVAAGSPSGSCVLSVCDWELL